MFSDVTSRATRRDQAVATRAMRRATRPMAAHAPVLATVDELSSQPVPVDAVKPKEPVAIMPGIILS